MYFSSEQWKNKRKSFQKEFLILLSLLPIFLMKQLILFQQVQRQLIKYYAKFGIFECKYMEKLKQRPDLDRTLWKM